jgi:hypothetical protein
MSIRFGDIVAIASGTAAKMAGLCKLLRAERIHFVVERGGGPREEDTPDHVELWVHSEDAERVKSILRRSVCNEGPSLS